MIVSNSSLAYCSLLPIQAPFVNIITHTLLSRRGLLFFYPIRDTKYKHPAALPLYNLKLYFGKEPVEHFMSVCALLEVFLHNFLIQKLNMNK